MAENPLVRPATPLLLAHGFTRKGGVDLFHRPLAPGLNAWLGLNSRSDPGRVSLSPTVGVRDERVQAWVTRLRDRDPGLSTAPTVQTTMGLLLPERRTFPHWVLAAGQDDHNAETWELFAHDLEAYVEPWWEQRATGDAVVAALRRGEGLDT